VYVAAGLGAQLPDAVVGAEVVWKEIDWFFSKILKMQKPEPSTVLKDVLAVCAYQVERLRLP